MHSHTQEVESQLEEVVYDQGSPIQSTAKGKLKNTVLKFINAVYDLFINSNVCIVQSDIKLSSIADVAGPSSEGKRKHGGFRSVDLWTPPLREYLLETVNVHFFRLKWENIDPFQSMAGNA